MSFRSLLADLVLSGTLSNAYEIAGTFTVGQVGGVSIVIDGVRDAILFYNATGKLLASLAPAAGSDSQGNSWVTGLRVGQAGNAGVVVSIASDGKTGLLYFPGTVPNKVIDAHLQLNQQGAGTGQVSFLTIGAATDQTQNDTAFVNLFSSSQDGTQNTHVTLTYQDPTGAVHSYVVVDCTGATITAASVKAVQPGTGTSRANPAVAETWHTLALSAGFSGGVAGTATPRYQLEAIGGGRTRLSGGVSLTANQAQGTTIGTLPAGYRPLNDLFINTANNLSGGATNVESLHILTTGAITLGVAGSNGNYVMLDGITFVLD